MIMSSILSILLLVVCIGIVLLHFREIRNSNRSNG
jgi:hypothetical protein